MSFSGGMDPGIGYGARDESRHQGAADQDGFRLPHRDPSADKHGGKADPERVDAANGNHAGLIGRIKRWFAARF